MGGRGQSGGAGGLAQDGLLTETVAYVPPDSDLVHLAGIVPDGATEVAPDARVTTRMVATHELLDVDLWVAAVADPPEQLTVTARDASGTVVQRHTVMLHDLPADGVAGFANNPYDLTGDRPASARAGTVETVATVGAFFAVFVGLFVLNVWARRRRDRGEEAGRTRAEGAEAMLHPRGPWS